MGPLRVEEEKSGVDRRTFLRLSAGASATGLALVYPHIRAGLATLGSLGKPAELGAAVAGVSIAHAQPTCFDWFESTDPYPTDGRRWTESGDSTDRRWKKEQHVDKGTTRVIHTGHFEALNFRVPGTVHIRINDSRDIIIAILQGGGTYDLAVDYSWSGAFNNSNYGQDLTQEQLDRLTANRFAEARKYKPDLRRAVVAILDMDDGTMSSDEAVYSRSTIDDMIARQGLSCS